jgi:hypothetical protein
LKKYEKGLNRFKIKGWDGIMKETAEGGWLDAVSWWLLHIK